MTNTGHLAAAVTTAILELSLVGEGAAHAAEPWPVRPVRIVLGSQAGSNTDVMARVLAPNLSVRLGQPFVVENRPGAGGAIGANLVAKATPDGYTLLFISGVFTGHAATVRTPYDPLRDFDWITTIVSYPFVLTARNGTPAHDAAELIALAKKNPGKLNYGSAGIGSIFHLAAELFNSMAVTDTVHVPYKGGPDALTDMLGGRIDFMFMTLTGTLPYIRTNRIRGLAICSRERSPRIPELPPLAESLPGYEVTSFAGIGTTAGAPRAVIAKLNRELHSIMAINDIARQFTDAGGDMRPASAEDTTRFVAEEIAKWRRVVKERRIEVK